jgi:hypothetical protein
MKRQFTLLLVFFALLMGNTAEIQMAQADTNNCNVGTVPPSFNYLNPPDDPTKVTPGTVLLGKLTAYAAAPDFGVFSLETKLEDTNSLPTYFFFYSADGGKSWFCERSYSTMATTELKPNQDYVAIVVASSQGARGISTVAKFSTKKQVVRLCAPEGTIFSVKYEGSSFFIELRKAPKAADIPRINYKVEVSIDGWKTKGVYRDMLRYGSFMMVKPLNMTATHEFRLVQNMDELNTSAGKPALVERYVSTGCATFATNAVAKDTRTDCEKNPSLEKCQITFVPGENAGSGETALPSSSPTPKLNVKSSIICIKGNLTRTVTGVKPKCPTGFKKK